MIKLGKYARMLLEAKMSVSLANKIFADLGYPNASSMPKDKLRAAWADLSTKHHPDKGGNVEIMQNINAAYDLLKVTPASPDDYFDTLYQRRYAAKTYKTHGHEPEPWQTDDRAMRDPDPQKPDINYYKKTAWTLSGKPESIEKNKYTFWDWDGYSFRGVFTVYTTPEHWFEVSKLMVEWDRFYRSKAVFVSYKDAPNKIFLVNKGGVKVEPPVEYEHESFNQNPANDWSFTNKLRKEI